MALAIDASTPASTGGLHAASGTTGTFSPPANSVIVLGILVNPSSFTGATSVTGVTDSLVSHLTWSLRVRANGFASANNAGGTAELWYASCPSAQTNMTVTPSWSPTAGGTISPDWEILPIVFTGAATTQAGATATANNTTAVASSPSVTLSGVAAGSWCIGCGYTLHNDTPAAGASQTMTINAHPDSGDNATDFFTWWFQTYTSAQVGAGSVTVNQTISDAAWNMVGLEVQAASTGPLAARMPTGQAVKRAAFY